MSEQSQAEIFIETLTELWNDDREEKKARLRRQLKARVNWFIHEFRTDIAGGKNHPSEWPRARISANQGDGAEVRSH